MLTTILISAGIGLIALLSYLTSAKFGCQSSQTGPLPPHYEQLLRHRRQPLQPSRDDDTAAYPAETEQAVSDRPANVPR